MPEYELPVDEWRIDYATYLEFLLSVSMSWKGGSGPYRDIDNGLLAITDNLVNEMLRVETLARLNQDDSNISFLYQPLSIAVEFMLSQAGYKKINPTLQEFLEQVTSASENSVGKQIIGVLDTYYDSDSGLVLVSRLVSFDRVSKISLRTIRNLLSDELTTPYGNIDSYEVYFLPGRSTLRDDLITHASFPSQEAESLVKLYHGDSILKSYRDRMIKSARNVSSAEALSMAMRAAI